MSDPRFARLLTDPRFRRPKKHQHKVVVDERFKDVFADADVDDGKGANGAKKKTKGGRVDKYGRKLSANQEKDNLRRFYRLEGDVADADKAQDIVPKLPDYARGEVLMESSDEDDGENDHEDMESDDDADGGEVVLGRHASKPIPVLADDDHLEIDLNEDDDAYADLDAQAAAYAKEHPDEAEPEENATKTNRLAVVNLDWDHVRASHLYKIFSSLVSPTASIVASTPSVNGRSKDGAKSAGGAKVVRGKILNVRVYPSEFGKERLKKEEIEGPPKEIFKKSRREDAEDSLDLIQEDEGDEYDEDALRRYQLERLRYYYAIVTCDTVDAAAHLMAELDGTELERTANVFDLSYVPDDMTFDAEFRDEATPATEAAASTHTGLDFSTDALRHSKVKLKWDEDDPERVKVLRRALTKKEIEEDDFRAYIASDSDSASEEEVGKKKADRDRIRNLLLSGNDENMPEGWDADPFGEEDKGAEGEMEITFMPGLSANAKGSDEEETTLERYKRKQKEKRLARKKELAEKAAAKKVGMNMKKSAAEDEFFGADSDSDEEDEGPKVEKHGKQSKGRSSSPAEARPHLATEAELELLAAPDDPAEKAKHFDMKAIVKAEKAKGRKRNRKAKKGLQDREDELQEDFTINVKDERFAALHEDPTFAIDPSNPRFKKTKSMAALLDERAKRQHREQRGVLEERTAKVDPPTGDPSLQGLVESVKRKSSQLDSKGSGKRRKL